MSKQKIILSSWRLVVLAVLPVLFTVSCRKKDNTDYGARFLGFRTYSGHYYTEYIGFVQGSTKNSIIVKGLATSGNFCGKFIDVDAIATENTLTFPPQAFVDYCDDTVTCSGYASLSDGLITISWTVRGRKDSFTQLYYSYN